MNTARRHRLTIAVLASTLLVLSGCSLHQAPATLSDLVGVLDQSAIVESVAQSSEPNTEDGQPDLALVTVDLDDAVSPEQLGGLLKKLDEQMDRGGSSLAGSVIRFAVVPGQNELSVDAHAQSFDGQFQAAADLWFRMGEHFDAFTVKLQYVDRAGWAMERVATADLGAVSWYQTSESLRTLTDIGAFDRDGDGTASSTHVTTAPSSPWWGDSRPAGIGFSVVGGAPSEGVLSALETLSALQDEGTAAFDFSGGGISAGGNAIGVFAVVPTESGASEAPFSEFEGSQAWAVATRMVDLLAASGAHFTLAIKIDGEETFATVDSESCQVTSTPFSQQLVDYWRGIGGSC